MYGGCLSFQNICAFHAKADLAKQLRLLDTYASIKGQNVLRWQIFAIFEAKVSSNLKYTPE